MSREAAVFELSVERLGRRLRVKYETPVGPEAFAGPGSMEDRPLYEWTRRLLKARARLEGRTFPRRVMDPPDGMDAALEHKTPQYFLRNVGRAERTTDDSPRFEVEETGDPSMRGGVGDLPRMDYEPPALLDRWNLEEVVRVRRLFRDILFDDDWTRRFGREIKERIRGPLFKYDPDVQDD
ncbi:MAG: hypothetical protein ISR64_01650 [Deltaproteobacteria bacterium]|nr:hypothetical protein [Deltaproteobacteria bacterium]